MILFWVLAAIVLLFGFVVAFGAPYVPSLKKEVKAAFKELYPVSKRDTVVDLGSGDGGVLLEAAKYGAKCYGYELNPLLVLISRIRLGRRGQVYTRNLWRTDLPEGTTLVYVFAVSRDIKRLETYLQAQAVKLEKPFMVMTFGATFAQRKPTRERKAHFLYEFSPLQA